MKRRLTVCIDGTWNTPFQEQYGEAEPTNVVRIHNAIADIDSADIVQYKYYHTGVGADLNFLKRFLGGMAGVGLDLIIKSAYHWLCKLYQDGDDIYLFGFSRGAFSVRSLCGLINKCGLLAPEVLSWPAVDDVYKAYRDKSGLHNLKPSKHMRTAPIHFIGVWDTVGALGIPDDLPVLNWLFDRKKNYRFHHTELGNSNQVTYARHALSLDDDRCSFMPTLWSNITKHDVDSGRVKQVWFPGEHGDVGGGRREHGLSDGALSWMIQEASSCGLAFQSAMLDQIKPNFRDTAHRACVGMYKHLRTQPRPVPLISPETTNVHQIATDRQKNPPISQAPYRSTVILAPGQSINVTIYACEHWNASGIFLHEGTYVFSARGEWKDAWFKLGPKGAKSKGITFWAKVFYGMADILVAVNYGFVTIVLGNPRADMWGLLKRVRDIPWFGLVGAIANCKNPGTDGTPATHELFFIGEKHKLKVEKPGYLYCFANDGWAMYGNNKGKVHLTVEKI